VTARNGGQRGKNAAWGNGPFLFARARRGGGGGRFLGTGTPSNECARREAPEMPRKIGVPIASSRARSKTKGENKGSGVKGVGESGDARRRSQRRKQQVEDRGRGPGQKKKKMDCPHWGRKGRLARSGARVGRGKKKTDYSRLGTEGVGKKNSGRKRAGHRESTPPTLRGGGVRALRGPGGKIWTVWDHKPMYPFI